MMEWVLVAFSLLLTALLVWHSRWFRSRLRAFEWNDRESYIRLWPNPGFRIRGYRWSVFYRRRIK